MPDEKDRLGDTLHKKERGEEERYFAEQDRQRIAKLRAQTTAAERAAACPRCGRTLIAPGAHPPAAGECAGGCDHR